MEHISWETEHMNTLKNVNGINIGLNHNCSKSRMTNVLFSLCV